MPGLCLAGCLFSATVSFSQIDDTDFTFSLTSPSSFASSEASSEESIFGRNFSLTSKPKTSESRLTMGPAPHRTPFSQHVFHSNMPIMVPNGQKHHAMRYAHPPEGKNYAIKIFEMEIIMPNIIVQPDE